MKDEDKPTFIEQFRKNWMIVCVISSAIIFYANSQKDFAQAKEDISELKTKINTMEVKRDQDQQQFYAIVGDIREIKTSVEFLKENIVKK